MYPHVKSSSLLKVFLGFSALLLNQIGFGQTIAINTSNPHQGIDGVGFCHEGDRENGDTYIIDEKIQQMLDNNMSLFRDMFPNRTFEPSKGSFNYTDSRVTNCWQRLKTMQDRGIVTILGIWDVPNRLVTNPSSGGGRRINNFDDFANMIYQFVKYGHDNYGVTINFIDVNETAESGVNIYLTSQEYSTFIQKCSALFASAGLSTKVNQGSVLLWDIAYDQDIYNTTKTLSGSGHPSWHSYRGGSLTGSQREDISLWQGWGNWQLTLDRNLWATETDYDAFYYNNPDRYTWTGCEEMAEMYYRNYYVARCSTSAGWYWHETADEDAYMSSAIHQAYMQNFEIGGQIVDVSQPDQYIRVVGYKHVAHNKFVIQALNEYSTDKTVTFTGVPTGVLLSLTRTSQAGEKLSPVGNVTANGTSLTVTLKAYSFTTFAGALSSSGGGGDTQAPSAPTSLHSTAVTATSATLAWNASTDNVGVVGYQVFNSAGTRVADTASTSATISGLSAVTSYTFTVKAYDAAGNFSGASNAATVTTAQSANIAYNRTVWTSSVQAAGYEGGKAVDANGNTRWSSAYSDNQTIYVDLGSNYNVNRVKLSWEAAYAKNYQIQFSTDGTNWTTVREFWGKTSAAADDQTGLSGTARYVKVYCINRATSYGFSLWEFEIYGTP